MDLSLIPFLLAGRAGRLSHFNNPQHHDVVLFSTVVGGTTIVGFLACFPFAALEVGDGSQLIVLSTIRTGFTTTTLWSDPFCCDRGAMKSNAARMLETMTRDARKMRSTLGFERCQLKIAKGPENEDHDGSESVRERP